MLRLKLSFLFLYDLTTGFGYNNGALEYVYTYNQGNSLVARSDYTLADSTIVRRRYSEVRNVTYSGSDSIVTELKQWYSQINGLPYQIEQEVSPFEGRGLTVTPASGDRYWLLRLITYACEQYSDMDTLNTHQTSAVWKEIVREEAKSGASTNSRVMAATWTTWNKQSGQNYWRPLKTYRWTGANADADTTLPGNPPGDTNEKVVVYEVVDSDVYGHILQEKDGEDRIIKYYYGDNSSPLSNSANGLQHRFLTGVRRLKGTSTTVS